MEGVELVPSSIYIIGNPSLQNRLAPGLWETHLWGTSYSRSQLYIFRIDYQVAQTSGRQVSTLHHWVELLCPKAQVLIRLKASAAVIHSILFLLHHSAYVVLLALDKVCFGCMNTIIILYCGYCCFNKMCFFLSAKSNLPLSSRKILVPVILKSGV